MMLHRVPHPPGTCWRPRGPAILIPCKLAKSTIVTWDSLKQFSGQLSSEGTARPIRISVQGPCC